MGVCRVVDDRRDRVGDLRLEGVAQSCTLVGDNTATGSAAGVVTWNSNLTAVRCCDLASFALPSPSRARWASSRGQADPLGQPTPETGLEYQASRCRARAGCLADRMLVG
jgi:hypothetical protein